MGCLVWIWWPLWLRTPSLWRIWIWWDGYGKRSADAEADAWYGYGGLTATDSQPMAVTAMARGLLMLRPSLRLMPGMDMVASTATDSQPMADMAMAVTATARGLLMLRPSLRLMPGTDMVASTATDSQPWWIW